MKRRFFAIGIGVLLLTGGTLAWLTLRGPGGPFALEGRVAGFGGEKTVYVEHGEVGGRLPARTTPLEASESAQLDSLEMGDAVRLEVAGGSGRLRITSWEKLADNALPRNPASAGERRAAAGKAGPEAGGGEAEMPGTGRGLQVGERVPDLELTNQNGEAVRLSDYRGQALVLTFIYTNCPLPNFCPLMSRQFATLQPKLKKRYGEEAQLLSISFDPKNDTPQVLTEYAQKYTGDFSTWTFSTPKTPAELEEAKEAFGITTLKKEGEIVHNLVTAFVGPRRKLVWKWRGNDWQPKDILQVAEQTLKSQTPKGSPQAASSSK